MTKFTIKKNKHSSKLLGFLPHIGFTFKNEISFICKFDSSCLYDLHDIDNYDTNKLYGVSTSYNHMIQSARIGWRCLDRKNIEIMAFAHDEHKFLEPQVLGTVKPNEEFFCKIIIEDFNFDFIFKTESQFKVISIAKKTKGWKFKYKLSPYFGGNKTAPHNMSLFLKEK